MNPDSPDLTASPQIPTPSGRHKGRRVWVFRIGAVALGLFAFVLLEAVCWCFGWGKPSLAEDPFVGFRAIHPLFEADEKSGQYAIPKARRRFFQEESFPVQKGENTFRIFC